MTETENGTSEKPRPSHETVPVDSLVPDPANVRLHGSANLTAIRASLRRFGQQKPIVVTHDGIVVAGNGTLEAAKSEGWTEINVVRTTLEGAERTAFAIADNRTAELAGWDWGSVRLQLGALESDGVDIDNLGWTRREIERMGGALVLGEPASADPEPQPGTASQIDLSAITFTHSCPRCGFGFDGQTQVVDGDLAAEEAEG